MAKPRRAAVAQPSDGGYVRGGADAIAALASSRVIAARSGDTEAASTILRNFVSVIGRFDERTWRGPVHLGYAQYIAEAFSKILGGEDAGRALGLKRRAGAGRRKGIVTHDPELLAAAYWFAWRNGAKSERALQVVAEVTGANRRTIQRAIKAGSNLAYKYPALIGEQILRSRIGLHASRIARILAADS